MSLVSCYLRSSDAQFGTPYPRSAGFDTDIGAYMRGGEKAVVIGYNGHFRAVVARLIEDPLLKFYEYIRIFFISGIQVSNMVLWLRSGAVVPLGDLSPFLLKVPGLNSTSITPEKG